LYAEFTAALPFLREASVIIEADSRPAESLAETMAQKILSGN
jgi:hypothetical protein